MAYEKQEFKDGQILTAEHLNRMSEGISDLQDRLDSGGEGGDYDDLTEVVPNIVASDLEGYGVTYDALASVINNEVENGGQIDAAIWQRAMEVHEESFYSDMENYGFLSEDEETGDYVSHADDTENPHQVNAEQIGAVGVEEWSSSRDELWAAIGDIETALDSILAIQNQLIGGETV